jgi:hypothetical protein
MGRTVKLIEKAVLGFIAGAAAAIGVTETGLLIFRVVHLATRERIILNGMPVGDVQAPAVLASSPQIVTAQYETIALAVEGLPPAVRGYLIAAAILASALAIGICAVVAWLCLRVFLGRPFVASATWGIGIVAILVIAGGLGSSLLTSIAHAEAAAFLGLGEAQGIAAFQWNADLAPLGWGLALAVVAGAFELGQRMQRDTEGLV